MSCAQTVESRQTEFEFFQQMLENKPVTRCCGPLVEIGFTRSSLLLFNEALTEIGLKNDYLDFYDPHVLDSSHMSFTMCSRHWAEHCTSTYAIGEKLDNRLWKDLSFYIFRVFCLTNEWDYKEIVNYFKNIISAKELG
jgi:hypothetical protein